MSQGFSSSVNTGRHKGESALESTQIILGLNQLIKRATLYRYVHRKKTDLLRQEVACRLSSFLSLLVMKTTRKKKECETVTGNETNESANYVSIFSAQINKMTFNSTWLSLFESSFFSSFLRNHPTQTWSHLLFCKE